MKRSMIFTLVLTIIFLIAASLSRNAKLNDKVTGQEPLPSGCSVPSFGAMNSFNAGTKIVAATTGDFNQDGKLDAVVVNYDSGSVTIYLGNGGGGLGEPATLSVGTNPVAIAKSDFDRNGKPDLVVTNAGSGNVSILLNQGRMQFAPATNFHTGISPRVTVVGDFNRDGQADLATANSGSDNISILLGNGAGGFAAAGSHATGPQPVSIAANDFNRDGKLDLVVGGNRVPNLTFLFGDGSGGFNTPTALGLQAPLEQNNDSDNVTQIDVMEYELIEVISGDLDRDGNPDLIWSLANLDLALVALGDGKGGFGAATSIAAGRIPRKISIGDVNGDGKPDIAVSSLGSNRIKVMLGNGAGAFPQVADYPVVSPPNLAASASLTDDPVSSPTAEWMDYEFIEAIIPNDRRINAEWMNYESIEMDFNGDGRPDMLVVSSLTNTIGVMLNRCVATQCPGISYASRTDINGAPVATALASADFNRDGRLDLASANWSTHNISIFLAKSTGGFNLLPGPALGSGSAFFVYALAVADFNLDGKADLAVSSEAENLVRIFLGDGTGQFSAGPNSPITVPGGPFSITSADLNRDGKPDLVTANRFGASVTILRGLGNGGMLNQTSLPSGGDSRYAAVGDFNRDGKLDLAVSNSLGTTVNDTVTILLGNGNLNFSMSTSIVVGDRPRTIAVADFNDDGWQDLAVLSEGNDHVAVLTNNGLAGGFGVTKYPTGDYPISLRVGDYNRDGRVDIATANFNSNNVSVLARNSSGGFDSPRSFSVGSQPHALVSDDFNRDGKADLATVHLSSSYLTVLYNNCSPTVSPFIEAAPSILNFGAVPLGQSRDLIVSIRNSGTASTQITALNIGPSVFTLTPPTLPADLAPGSQILLTVRFTPSSFNNVTGTLSITSSGPTQTIVPLSGFSTCGFILDTQSASFDAAGGQGSVNVTGSSSCPRNAVSDQSWITITSGSSGSGNGTVGFVVSPNTGSVPRQGVITIGDQVYVVIQGGTGGPVSPCADINFLPAYYLTSSNFPNAVKTDDFNNDGKLDLLTVSAGSQNFYRLETLSGDGYGVFKSVGVITRDFIPDYGLLTLAVADFNKDKNKDAALVRPGNDDIALFHGIGNGGFNIEPFPVTGHQPVDIALIDFNHDGTTDLVTANAEGKSLSLLPGDKAGGGFGVPIRLDLHGVTPRSVAIGDFNNDGNSDIAVVSTLWHSIQIYLGKNNFFDYAGIFRANFHPVAATVGDFNLDGKADLAVAKQESGGSVLLGRGDGTFDPERNLSGVAPYYSVVTADFNIDNKPDLVFTDVGTNKVVVYANDGSGNFSTSPKIYPVGIGPYSLVSGDFDGNGRPDLATANAYSNNIAILLNNCLGKPFSDLSITKANDSSINVPGTTTTFTIVATNKGPDFALGAKVIDNLPSQFTNISWTCAATIGSACKAGNGTGALNSEVDLAKDGKATFKLTARIYPWARYQTINNAEVIPPADGIDPDRSNNTASSVVRFEPVADLAISKTNNSTTIVQGDWTAYTITVTNLGPSDANRGGPVTESLPVVSDFKPEIFTEFNWTCSASVGAKCTVVSGTGNVNTSLELFVGGTATLLVKAKLNPAATGTVSNQAIIAPATGVTDPLTSNNSSTDTDAVVSRIVRIVPAVGLPASTIGVPVELDSFGNEHAIGFSVSFNPAILSNPDAILGMDSAGGALVKNGSESSQGRFGVGVSLSPGQVYMAGKRQIAILTFTASDALVKRSTPINFIDQPVKREVVDVNAMVLYATFLGNTVDIVPVLEADVAPRPEGNIELSIADWAQVGRFVAGLDVTGGTEFQRADSAPRNQKGDGKLAAGDWTQAGRYAVALDPPTLVGGPTVPDIPMLPNFRLPNESFLLQLGREVRVVSSGIERGLTGTASIEYEATGTENSFSFTLAFDPAQLTYVRYDNGSGIGGASVLVNATQAALGRLGVAIALPPGQSMTAGIKELLRLTFMAKAQGNPGTTAIGFANQPVQCEVADVDASPLGCNWATLDLQLLRTVTGASAADYGTAELAAESIIAAFGRNLATTTLNAPGIPLPTELGGTTVKVKDSAGVERLAPLFFVSPEQINFQIPAGTATGTATLIVTSGDGVISNGPMVIAALAPSLFTADASGHGLAAAQILRVKPDGSFTYENVFVFDPILNKTVAVPIEFGPEGDQPYLILFGTGIRGRSSSSAVTVSIGGTGSQVLYAGAQGEWVGLDQVNVALSRSLAGRGEVEVVLTADGKTANSVSVAFK